MQACQAGSAIDCYRLALPYQRGTQVRKDMARAASLFEKSCTGGLADGCYELAQLVQTGTGVTFDRDRAKALRAVRETQGAYISVTDEQILAAIPVLAQGCGVFAEPAGAAAYAGLQQAVADGVVRADESVAMIVTGSGLKDIRSAMKSVGQAVRVKPSVEAVRAAMADNK